jgi:hypothetical protein
MSSPIQRETSLPLENIPEEVEEKPQEEESQRAEPKSLPNLLTTLAIPDPKPSEKGGNSNFGFHA